MKFRKITRNLSTTRKWEIFKVSPMNRIFIHKNVIIHSTEVYSEPCLRSKMKFFAKKVDGFYPWTIFAKDFILDVWQDSENTSVAPVNFWFSPSFSLAVTNCNYYFCWWHQLRQTHSKWRGSELRIRRFIGKYFKILQRGRLQYGESRSTFCYEGNVNTYLPPTER